LSWSYKNTSKTVSRLILVAENMSLLFACSNRNGNSCTWKTKKFVWKTK